MASVRRVTNAEPQNGPAEPYLNPVFALQVTLLELAEEVAAAARLRAVGGDEGTLREKPRWQVSASAFRA